MPLPPFADESGANGELVVGRMYMIRASATTTGEMCDRVVALRLGQGAGALAILVFTLGWVVLAGWALGVEAIRRIPGTGVGMNPVTAAAFVLLGGSLAGKLLWLPRRRAWVLAQAAAAGAMGLGFIRLCAYAAGYSVWLDSQLFDDQVNPFGFGPDRMAPNTAAGFVIAGLAALLLDFETAKGRRPAQYLALANGALATLGVLGYAYSVESFYRMTSFYPMALHTAAGFLLVSLAVLAARPDRGMMALISGTSAGSILARRLLPAVLLVPPILGLLRLEGERAGLYGRTFGTCLLTVSMMAILAGVVALTATSVHRFDLRRTAAEEALRLSEERFSLGVRGSSDGLWDWRPGSDEVWYSPRYKELLGYADDEFPNRVASWEEHVHPDDRERTWRAVDLHLRRDTPFDVEFRLRHKSGPYRWFRVRGRAARNDLGQAVRMSGSLQDVTELKEAEKELIEMANELARSNKDLEEFAYVASHDLRAPLRAIGNLAQWLEEDLAERLDQENRERMELLRNRVARLDRLIEDLLLYSRAGRVLGKIQQVDTGELVDEIAELLAPPAGFEIVKASTFPAFTTSSTALQQVLRNLISNAVKHHDRTCGRVEVHASAQGEFYEFGVRDDGPGIPPEYHARVFQMFETLKPRDSVEGSGMGLAIVKRTIEKLGGRIWIESQGRGTTFRFTWPRDLLPDDEPGDGPAGKTREPTAPAVAVEAA